MHAPAARAAHADIIRRDKRTVKTKKGKERGHEPGVCLRAIYPASEPEKRAIEHNDGK
jgi:hypothetical protein